MLLTDKINFCSKTYTVEDFINKFYADASEEEAIISINGLIDRGDAYILTNLSKEATKFNRVQKEQIVELADKMLDNETEMYQDKLAKDKREGRLTYEKKGFVFASSMKAQEFCNYAKVNLRIKTAYVRFSDDMSEIYSVFENITDAELNKLSLLYKTDKFISGAVNKVGVGANKVTSAIHYGATKVVAPSATVLAKSGASLLKTLASTGVKTAATLVSATAKGIKEASNEIKNDADVIKAAAELIKTKNSLKRQINSFKKNNSNGSGIVDL